VLSFVGFAGFGMYAAIDEPNIGAAMLSVLFLLSTLGCAIWCVVAFVLIRKRGRAERRGFAVLTDDQTQRKPTARGGSDG
jgi:hypothetical protein